MGAGWQRWWREPPKEEPPHRVDEHDFTVVHEHTFPGGTRAIYYACGCSVYYAPGSIAYCDGI